MRTLAAIEPAQAIAVADQCGVDRDHGSLGHIVIAAGTYNFRVRNGTPSLPIGAM
jgi:hypothetical protein